MDSDDDDFLYGGAPEPAKATTSFVQQPTPIDAAATVAVVARLEDDAESAVQLEEDGYEDSKRVTQSAGGSTVDESEENVRREDSPEEMDQDEDEESDDDIEIIMAQPVRSIDHRPTIPGSRPPAQRAPSTSTSAPRGTQPSLTTEYTPISRGPPPAARPAEPVKTETVATATATPEIQPSETISTTDTIAEKPIIPQYDGPDPATLPPTEAPASHPIINPTITATLDGRSILDVDLDAMTESGKAWRRPGSDLSDWFNYGFDELSWEAYCYRRRDLGEMGGVLKANLITFSGMPEDQIGVLPAEVRQMVMTGSTALVSGNNMNGNMLNAGGMGIPGMNMMDMAMNPMMMNGMNGMGDMGMQQMMMQQQQFQDGNPAVSDGTSEQAQMMQEYPMGMNMEFGMDGTQQMYPQQPQQIQPAGENQNTASVSNGPPVAPANRGIAVRGARGVAAVRGVRGSFVRGRGRGGVTPSAPGRPTSPLPPNVPTGPRNQNKYKDRDTNAPAVDGLDYGGGGSKDRDGGRTPSREPEERGSNRKRRSSPGMDDPRGSKRR